LATKQQIQNIKTNIERTIQGLRTKPQEFTYQQTGGFVQPNTVYSVYYTLIKDEVYLTGITSTSNSKIINNVKNETSFKTYKKLKFPTRIDYPVSSKPKPTDTDYRIGAVTRYFAQIGNDTTQPIFEISKDDFEKQNTLYKYTSFSWTISGKREDVIMRNQTTIIQLQVNYPGIIGVLWPLQLWKPPEGSSVDIQKKLLLLKKD
jgi:hypothetical protein